MNRTAMIEHARQAAEAADRAYTQYLETYGNLAVQRPGFDRETYVRLMRDAETTYGSYAELRYGTQ
jgi:hypothetical protein